MSLTTLIACQVLAAADVPGRREELHPLLPGIVIPMRSSESLSTKHGARATRSVRAQMPGRRNEKHGLPPR